MVSVHEESFNYASLKDHYICTLQVDCFEEIKGTDIKSSDIGPLPVASRLHTAHQISLHDDALKFITQCSKPSKKVSSVGTKSSSAKLCSSTSHDKVEPTWINCAGYHLTLKEKHILNQGELTDLHINAACALLKQQFPHQYGGFQSTLLQQSNKPLLDTTNAVQVLHVNGRHWIVISCDKNTLNLYDSLYSGSISLLTGHTIVSLMKTVDSVTIQVKMSPDKLEVQIVVFMPIAYCTSLVHSVDPCLTLYVQEEMRPHM